MFTYITNEQSTLVQAISTIIREMIINGQIWARVEIDHGRKWTYRTEGTGEYKINIHIGINDAFRKKSSYVIDMEGEIINARPETTLTFQNWLQANLIYNRQRPAHIERDCEDPSRLDFDCNINFKFTR